MCISGSQRLMTLRSHFRPTCCPGPWSTSQNLQWARSRSRSWQHEGTAGVMWPPSSSPADSIGLERTPAMLHLAKQGRGCNLKTNQTSASSGWTAWRWASGPRYLPVFQVSPPPGDRTCALQRPGPPLPLETRWGRSSPAPRWNRHRRCFARKVKTDVSQRRWVQGGTWVQTRPEVQQHPGTARPPLQGRAPGTTRRSHQWPSAQSQLSSWVHSAGPVCDWCWLAAEGRPCQGSGAASAPCWQRWCHRGGKDMSRLGKRERLQLLKSAVMLWYCSRLKIILW